MSYRRLAPLVASTLGVLVPVSSATAAPAPGRLTIAPQNTSGSPSAPAVLAGDTIRVRGELRPAVPGQKVIVRASFGPRRVYRRVVRVQPVGSYGRFSVEIKTNRTRSGLLRIEASHLRSAEIGAVRAKPRRVRVIARSTSSPLAVSRLQAGLAKLGYATSRSGVFDAATARAVLAYRKVNGMARTSSADAVVFDRVLRGVGAFRVRFPSHGRHVEADLSTQTMALIENGRPAHTYHISSGAPATPTILGSFRVYWKDFGTNGVGMVHSSYFRGGYAIHGYRSVPTYPASHGCLRVPIPSAKFIYDWVRLNTIVDVYP